MLAANKAQSGPGIQLSCITEDLKFASIESSPSPKFDHLLELSYIPKKAQTGFRRKYRPLDLNLRISSEVSSRTCLYTGSVKSAHVLLNLFNELGK